MTVKVSKPVACTLCNNWCGATIIEAVINNILYAPPLTSAVPLLMLAEQQPDLEYSVHVIAEHLMATEWDLTEIWSQLRITSSPIICQLLMQVILRLQTPCSQGCRNKSATIATPPPTPAPGSAQQTVVNRLQVTTQLSSDAGSLDQSNLVTPQPPPLSAPGLSQPMSAISLSGHSQLSESLIQPLSRSHTSVDANHDHLLRVFNDSNQFKYVTLSDVSSYESIMTSILERWGVKSKYMNRFAMFLVPKSRPESPLDSSRVERRLAPAEMLFLCSRTGLIDSRHPKDRFVLRKLRDDQVDSTATNFVNESDAAMMNALEPVNESVESSATSAKKRPLHRPPPPPITIDTEPKNTSTISAPRSSPIKKLERFFGERPPSQMISENLDQFFPVQRIHAGQGASALNRRKTTIAATSSSRSLYSLSPTETSSLLKRSPSQMESAQRSPSNSASFLAAQAADAEATQQALALHTSCVSIKAAKLLGAVTGETSPKVTEPVEEVESDSEVAQPIEETSHADDENLTHQSLANGNASSGSERSGPDSARSGLDSARSSGLQQSWLIMEGEEQINTADSANGKSGAVERFVRGKRLGKGSFGDVYLCLNTVTGALMAMKRVPLLDNEKASSSSVVSATRRGGQCKALQREMETLKTLDHENIVRYVDSHSSGEHMLIFLEYVPGGSIRSMLDEFGAFDEGITRRFVRQILHGLEYLHRNGIMHRDIKGGNVLVNDQGVVKISDFGLSKRMADGIGGTRGSGLQGSTYWMAPEVVKSNHYTFYADIWSLGCLMIEMLTGKHPWSDCGAVQALYNIGRGMKPSYPANKLSSSIRSFMDKCLVVEYELRFPASTLLRHRFIVNGTSAPSSSTPVK